MMRGMRTGLLIAGALAVLAPRIVRAEGAVADDVVIGQPFTLAAGQTLAGNLIAVGSQVKLDQGSTVEGDIVLFGGSMESAGKIAGQVASIGGSIHFDSTAIVSEDVAVIGPVPQLDTGAKISGSLNSVREFSLPASWPAEERSLGGLPSGWFLANAVPEKPDYWYEGTALLFKVFLLSAVAVLVVLFLPLPARRVARTIAGQPAVSFLIGMLTMVAAAAFLLLLAFTICLSPVSLLGTFILLAAVLLGWVALGWGIGERLARVAGAHWHPAVQAGVGTMILTLVASGLGYIPCAGSLLDILILSFGLGAVVLTRFGGQDFRTDRTERPALTA
jgi:hypothetical protein